MRIAIIQPRTSYHIAGSEKISLKHAEYLAKLGHTVDLYTSVSKELKETFLFNDFVSKKIKGVNILRFDISDLVPGLYEEKQSANHVRWVTESIAFDQKIFNAINESGADIILSYYLPDNLFKPKDIPNVLYLSGYSSESIPLYKSFIRFCSATISISSVVSEKWSEYLNDVPLQYSLGTGVDYPLVIKDQIKPKAKYNIVFAGRLIERKGVSLLVDAFKKVVADYDDVHLWILGDGDLQQTLRSKIDSLDLTKKISMLGLVHNPYDYFAMADICVFPSYQGDGLMGTVLESMAAGKAVVTTKNNGNEDVITSGLNGVLIESQDSDKLAVTILDLLKDDETRLILGQRAQEFIAQNVAWEKNILKLEHILKEVVEKTK